jgi:hypothetical protein
MIISFQKFLRRGLSNVPLVQYHDPYIQNLNETLTVLRLAVFVLSKTIEIHRKVTTVKT